MSERRLLSKAIAVVIGIVMALMFAAGSTSASYANSYDPADQHESGDIFSFREGKFLNKMRKDARSYPESFDLRNVPTLFGKKSYVTPVRLQNPYGTCWGFAAVAAAESSLIADGLADRNVDLSEKQLAYFATSYIDDPTDPQYGEGMHFIDLSTKDLQTSAYRYDTGGTMLFATNVFASGVGPTDESAADVLEYKGARGEPVVRNVAVAYNADGTPKRYDRRPVWMSKDDDWSIPEDHRYSQSYKLKESYMLPGVYVSDDGELDRDSLLGIKQQMYKEHRAVTINFCAESYVPGQETDNKLFMNDKNWAHYTFRPEFSNHSVTIVGWDDNYPKENFRHPIDEPGCTEDDTVPPGDGAFLIKNSWGSELNGSLKDNYKNNGFRHWGLLEGLDSVPYDPKAKAKSDKATGYFWISYYDNSINDPESFVFEKASAKNDYDIEQMDMAYTANENFIERDGIRAANVFKVDRTSDLKEISVMTAVPGTRMSYEVYALPDNYTDPEDGLLLTEGDTEFTYGGYHNIRLSKTATLAKDQLFSVVITTESDPSEYFIGGNNVLVKYARIPKQDASPYEVTVVNKGESFFFNGEEWQDIADEETQKELISPGYMSIENFPIKAYLKPVSSAYLAVNNWYDGTPGTFDLTIGYGKTLTAEFRGFSQGSLPLKWPEVSWESSDESIVTVTPKEGDSGEAKADAYSEGKAYITVKAGKYGMRVIGINAHKPQIDDFNFPGWEDEYEYTGEAIEPEVEGIWVRINDDLERPDLEEGVDYIVDYSNNIEPGTATATVTGIGTYGGTASKDFTIIDNGGDDSGDSDDGAIDRSDNSLSAKGKSVKLKASKLKKKKQIVKASGAYNISDADGNVSFRKLSVSKKKYAKKFKVNSTTGNITVGKGVKKGKYKIKVAIAASGDSDHDPAETQVTVTVRVK